MGVSCRERGVLYRTVLDRRRRILPRGIRPYADQPAYAIHARGVDRHVFDMAVRDIGIAAHAADQRSDPFSLNLGIVVQWDRYVFQRQLLDRRLLAQRLADESFGVGNDVDVEVGDGVARSVEFAVEGAFVDARSVYRSGSGSPSVSTACCSGRCRSSGKPVHSAPWLRGRGNCRC